MKTDEYLKAAASEIERQALENPGVSVDPDLADYMGAFEERAVSLEDFDPLDEEEEL